jgi:hypothetical protein
MKVSYVFSKQSIAGSQPLRDFEYAKREETGVEMPTPAFSLNREAVIGEWCNCYLPP